MCQRVCRRLRRLCRRGDPVPAWLAILLWAANWTQGYTNLHGLINLAENLLKGDWEDWKPITCEPSYMIILSLIYWAAWAIVFVLAGSLVSRIWRRPEDDLAREVNAIRDLSQTVDRRSGELVDAIKELKGGTTTKASLEKPR